jgi:hypothetical protein
VYTELWLEESEGRRPLGNCGINGRIILKWILRKYIGRMLDSCVSVCGPVFGLGKTVMTLSVP